MRRFRLDDCANDVFARRCRRRREIADLDRRYRVPLIRYFGKRIREAYDVDDLVQEVFIRLVRQAAIESVQQIDSYVFQTAANVIRDRARRHAAVYRSANARTPSTTAGSNVQKVCGATSADSPNRQTPAGRLL